MAYEIVDIELTKPLPVLSVDHVSGLALILRRKSRVVGFLMRPISSERTFDREQLAQMIAEEIGTRWIQETIREELQLCSAAAVFPSLTVAVCTRDRPDCLNRCLQSLVFLRQNLNENDSFQIMVVDNASPNERTKHVVSKFSDVRYVTEIRPGLNFARNRAIRETEGELLAYVDDDVVVDRFWLRGLKEAWSENPDAAAFTGQVLPLELETEAQIIFEQRGGFRRGFEKVRYTSSAPSGDDGLLYPCGTGIFGVGCNMAFSRRILLEIGGFDVALDTGSPLPGGGDHDIFYRIIRAGYPLIYEPGYLVFHQHRRTMEQLRHQYWTWGLGTMAFVSKAHRLDGAIRSRWRKMIFFWYSSHVRELIAAVLGHHCLPARFLLWELFGGVVGLCGEYKRSSRRVAEIQRKHQ